MGRPPRKARVEEVHLWPCGQGAHPTPAMSSRTSCSIWHTSLAHCTPICLTCTHPSRGSTKIMSTNRQVWASARHYLIWCSLTILLLLLSFYGGAKGTLRLGNLPKATELVNSRMGVTPPLKPEPLDTAGEGKPSSKVTTSRFSLAPMFLMYYL